MAVFCMCVFENCKIVLCNKYYLNNLKLLNLYYSKKCYLISKKTIKATRLVSLTQKLIFISKVVF